MLAEDVRHELSAIAPPQRCDALAEISALFHTAGALHLRGHSEVSLHLDLAAATVARRAFALLRGLEVTSEIRMYQRRAFDRETRYQLHVEGSPEALEVLREAGVLSGGAKPAPRPPNRVVGRRCCRAAYLRGALLGSGSVSGPRAPHLEIRFPELDGAAFVARIAAQEDVSLRTRDRGRYAAAYARGAETIADALALAGASDAALVIDEHAVVGTAKAAANRLANADHANLVRTSRAAHAQITAVRALEAAAVLGDLPAELQEMAALRTRLPAASIRELAARCDPPASKATAQRRLARLVELAGNTLAT